VLKQAGGRRGSCFGHGGHHLPLSCTLPGLNGEICDIAGECELVALSIPERQAGGPQLADDYMSPTPLAALNSYYSVLQSKVPSCVSLRLVF